MEHIELALSVLRSAIFNLKNDLDYGHWLPKQEAEIKEDIEKLNKAIDEIQKHFNA